MMRINFFSVHFLKIPVVFSTEVDVDFNETG